MFEFNIITQPVYFIVSVKKLYLYRASFAIEPVKKEGKKGGGGPCLLVLIHLKKKLILLWAMHDTEATNSTVSCNPIKDLIDLRIKLLRADQV